MATMNVRLRRRSCGSIPKTRLWLNALVVGTALVGLAACAAIPDNMAGKRAEPLDADSLVSTELLKRGEYVALAANCRFCHTAPNGKAFAGGRVLKTDFGEFNTRNITPDAKTGIGEWTREEFTR